MAGVASSASGSGIRITCSAMRSASCSYMSFERPILSLVCTHAGQVWETSSRVHRLRLRGDRGHERANRCMAWLPGVCRRLTGSRCSACADRYVDRPGLGTLTKSLRWLRLCLWARLNMVRASPLESTNTRAKFYARSSANRSSPCCSDKPTPPALRIIVRAALWLDRFTRYRGHRITLAPVVR